MIYRAVKKRNYANRLQASSLEYSESNIHTQPPIILHSNISTSQQPQNLTDSTQNLHDPPSYTPYIQELPTYPEEPHQLPYLTPEELEFYPTYTLEHQLISLGELKPLVNGVRPPLNDVPKNSSSPTVDSISSPDEVVSGREDSEFPQDYKDGDFVRAIPCHHLFHKNCLDNWLTKNKPSCPTCKADLHKPLDPPQTASSPTHISTPTNVPVSVPAPTSISTLTPHSTVAPIVNLPPHSAPTAPEAPEDSRPS
ncbi:RING finger protein [Smittium mucronatum]|uniref:RING finger protein n=1 Tax=Smittium mucronatum TaxID=133383 RepID=A0A1R0H346_9FUNG|nr:RING finger protein [Smittium mucronatum]